MRLPRSSQGLNATRETGERTLVAIDRDEGKNREREWRGRRYSPEERPHLAEVQRMSARSERPLLH